MMIWKKNGIVDGKNRDVLSSTKKSSRLEKLTESVMSCHYDARVDLNISTDLFSSSREDEEENNRKRIRNLEFEFSSGDVKDK